MKTADQWFDDYGESHRHRTNKIVHWICVPLIVASVIGLVWDIPVPSPMQSVPLLNWATVLIVLSMIFYFRLSIPLAIGMLLFSTAVIAIIMIYEQTALSPVWQLALAVFVAAWIGQFVGHRVEGQKPSFFQDLQFLLIGFDLVVGFVYRKIGIRCRMVRCPQQSH